jgi:splicing factor 1
MSWRNQQGITGSNNIPLGKRRFGGDDEGASEASTPTLAASDNGALRGRSPTRGEFDRSPENANKKILTFVCYSRPDR